MRLVWSLLLVLLLPAASHAQSLELFASGGATVRDPGNSFTAGAGFSPHRLLTLVFGFERTHLETEMDIDEHGIISRTRGGTLYLGTGELRVSPWGRARFGPYGVAGLAGGISRPNVNPHFPNEVTNKVAAIFVGGGVHVPLGTHVRLFGDLRLMGGAEGVEGVVAVMPVRAGIGFEF